MKRRRLIGYRVHDIGDVPQAIDYATTEFPGPVVWDWWERDGTMNRKTAISILRFRRARAARPQTVGLFRVYRVRKVPRKYVMRRPVRS